MPSRLTNPLPHAPDRHAPPRCWERLQCDRDLCPAYGKTDAPCWRVQNTWCEQHPSSDCTLKFERCLACPVFDENAHADPRGWRQFTAEQLKDVIRDSFGQALENMESFFQILTSLPDALFTVDKECRVNYFNPAAEQITGLSASEVIGRNCKHVLRFAPFESGSDGEITLQGGEEPYTEEFEIAKPGGEVVPVISSASVIRDQQGALIGGVEIFKDITFRKRLEDELKLSEVKYRRIFEGSKDMIFVISKEGDIREVNQAAVDLLGYASKDELLSLESVEQLYTNPMHAQVFEKQINRWGFIKDFETFFKTKDGIRVHCLLSGNAVRRSDGAIVGYEGIAKDISARMDAIQSLQQRHRELSLLNSVALAMNATQDLDVILLTALEKVLEVLNLKAGGVFLIDHARSAIVLRVQRGLPEYAAGKDAQIVFRDEALMRSLLNQAVCLTPDHAYPHFLSTLKDKRGADAAELTCFLITGKETPRGFLALDIPPGRKLTEQDRRLLGSLGNFLGGAIENARLHETVRQHREELQGLTALLFQSQEFERKRIARELHDEAGQALTGIHFTLETIDKSLSPELEHVKGLISDVRKQINHTYQEMRRLSHRLHPALLADLGLEPAIDAYLARIGRHSGLEIDFRMVGFGERLDPEVEICLYRLSQEAFTNTLKHSGAKQFKLSIVKSYPHIIFVAEDDGSGFDPREVEEQRQALGLVCMRERSAMLGGTFSLRTGDGTGTQIRIEIPVREPASD